MSKKENRTPKIINKYSIGNENNFKCMFDDVPIGIFHSSPEGELYEVNKYLMDILRYKSPDELISTVNRTNLKECIYVDKENRSKFVKNALKDSLWHSHQIRFYRKDGNIILAELSLKAVKSSDGSVKYLKGFIRDIIEHKNVEKAIKPSDLYYKTIFENTGTAVLIFREDTIISLVNTECEKFSGYLKEEIEGKKSWMEFIAEEDKEKLMNYYYLRKANSNSAPKNYEFKLINKQGNIRDIYANIVSIPYTTDRLASLIDITERKKVEESLKDSENRYRKLLENSFDAVLIHDGKKFISANSVAMELLGIKNSEELFDEPVLDFIHPKYHKIATERIQKMLENGETLPLIEQKFLKADGTSIDVEVLAVGFIYKGEKAVQAVFRDISHRKNAEKALKESEKKYRDLTELLPQSIFENDLNGKITFTNRFGLELFGYTWEDLDNGVNVSQILAPNDHDNVIKDTQGLFNGQKIRVMEFTALKKDGTIFPVMVYSSPIVHENKIVGFRGTIIDTTEIKKAENEIKASLKEKEVLLREIHHRVKNNLQIISSLLDLQANYVGNKEFTNVLQESQNRIKSMAIIHEMLYQSNNLSDIDFSNYIRNLVQYLFYSYGAKSNVRSIIDTEQIFLNIETAIPCGLIISELVSNSLKYAFPNNKVGEILVDIHSDEEEFKLVISDDGIGLPENLDFKNVNASLGLRLVNMLVDQLDGSIELDKSHGTKFVIKFKELKYKKRF